MANYDNALRIKEITPGDEDGTWGGSTNTNWDLASQGFSSGTIQFAANANETFTIADGALSAARCFHLTVTSAVTLTATRTVTLAPSTVSKVWVIRNNTTGTQSISIKQGSGAEVTIAKGDSKMIATDGAGAGAAVIDILSTLPFLTKSIFDTEHEADDGKHKYLTLAVQGADVTPPTGGGAVYIKNVSGSPQVFIAVDGGTPIQLSDTSDLNVSIPDATLAPQIINVVQQITTPAITSNYSQYTRVNVTISAGVATIDWSLGTFFVVTVDQNFGVEFTNVPTTYGAEIKVLFISSGDYNITSMEDLGGGYTVRRPEGAPNRLSRTGTIGTPTYDGITCVLADATNVFIYPVNNFQPI